MLRRALRLAAALALAAAATLATTMLLRPASASTTDPVCAASASQLQVSLRGGPPVVVAYDAQLGAFTVTPSTSCTGPYVGISEITFDVQQATQASTVVLDASIGAGDPCVTVDGSIGDAGTAAKLGMLDVEGAQDESLTAGATGVNLDPGVCDGDVGQLSGAGADVLAGGTGVDGETLSDGGGAGTGAAATVATTMSAGGVNVAFEGKGGDTVDFSAAAAGVTVNLSGATQTLTTSPPQPLDDGQAAVPGGVDSISGADHVIGSSAGGNVFYAGAHSYVLDAASSTVDLEAGSVVATTGSNDTFNGGAGTESVTATGDGEVFNGGSGSDTFTVTGSGADFVAGSGAMAAYGGTGGTVDFSHVATSGSNPLAVNVSGAPQSVVLAPGAPPATVANGGAETGAGTVYSFLDSVGSTSTAGFTTFAGASTGFTEFLAGGAGGRSFSASGGGDSIDFSAATSGVTVNLGDAPRGGLAPGQVDVGAAHDDTISGLTTVTGSAAGGNTMDAGSHGPYSFTAAGDGNVFVGGSSAVSFTATGTGNNFVAGSGAGAFSDPSAGNTVDFSALASPLTVNVSGQTLGSVLDHTATAGATTYRFMSLPAGTSYVGANPTTGGTLFDAGLQTNAFHGQGLAGDTLAFPGVGSGSLTLCLADTGASPCSGVPGDSTGQAVIGAATSPFSGMTVFDGLAAGNTTFVSGPGGGYTLDASGSGNHADFSDATPGTAGLTVDLTTTPATVSGFADGSPDSMLGVSAVIGAASGGTTFRAGPNSETFGQTGAGSGDTLDLSAVLTSQSAPLTLHLSGGGPGAGTATAGPATYTFTQGESAFTGFDGPATGSMHVLAGGTPGYTLSAAGSDDVLDFSAATSGVLVNLSAATHGGVAPAHAGVGAGTDAISGFATVMGSIRGGNSFYGGDAGPYSFTGNGVGNVFAAGPGAATFVGDASGDTVDFSLLSTSLTVNLSGALQDGVADHTAAAGLTTYTFTSLPAGTTYVGASPSTGGTLFDAGSQVDTLQGHGLAGDTLAFPGSSGTLTMCLADVGTAPCTGVAAGSTGQAVLGAAVIPFSGITVFDGPSAATTRFVSGTAGGYTLDAGSGGDVADFTAATATTPGVTVDLAASPATVSGFAGGLTDTLHGFSSVIGSASGGNAFEAGSGSESFAQPGSGGGDTVDFTALDTGSAPLTVNLSGSTASGGVLDHTAVLGAATYTFTSGAAAFTGFIGAGGGDTDFLASPDGGYHLTGAGSGNTGDFSAAPAAVSIDVGAAGGQVSGLGGGAGAATTDTVAGIQTYLGSPLSTALTPTTFVTECAGGLTFTGQGLAATSVLAISGCAAATPITVDTTTTPATVSGLPGGVDRFSGVHGVVGPSSGDTTFRTAGGAGSFTGNGGGNVLDGEALPAHAVIDAGAGTVIGGPAFSGVQCLTGSADGETTFVLPSTETSPSQCPQVGGVGRTVIATGSGNLLDLGNLPATGSSPAVLDAHAGSITLGGTLFATYAMADPAVAGPLGGHLTVETSGEAFDLTAQGSGNAVSFAGVPASLGGVHLGLSTQAGTAAGSFSVGAGQGTITGVSDFTGSPGDDTVVPAAAYGDITFDGGGGSDRVDLGAVPAPTVSLAETPGPPAASTATVTSGTSVLTARDVSTFLGSAGGGSNFVADSFGGYTFTGRGGGNTLSFQNFEPSSGPGVHVSATGGSGSATGLATGLPFGATADSFSDIQSFTGAGGSTANTLTLGDGSYATLDGGSSGDNTLSFGAAFEPVEFGDPISGASEVRIRAGGTLLAADFTRFDRLLGSDVGGNLFHAPAGGGYAFAGYDPSLLPPPRPGAMPPATSSLDLAFATTSPTVDILDGRVTGLSATGDSVGGATADSFAGFDTFLGAAQPTLFQAPCAGGVTVVSPLRQLGTLEVDGCDATAPPHLSATYVESTGGDATGTVTGGGGTISFVSMLTIVGPATGNTSFLEDVNGGGLVTLTGRGSGNLLDLSAFDTRTGVAVSVNGDSAAQPGTVTGLPLGPLSFAGINAFAGTEPISSPIAATPATLAQATVGVAYAQQLGGSGGTAPYAGFSVESGTLPPGLVLSPSGRISGTPTAGGPFSVRVQLDDAHGVPGIRSYSMTVHAAALTLSPPSGTTLARGVVGAAYAASITAGRGTAPYTYVISAGALPPGLSLDAATGAISGAPAAAGRYGFTVRATDSSGGTGPYSTAGSYVIEVKKK